MIPVSAMILLGLTCEIEQNRLFNGVSSIGLEAMRYGAISLGIVFLVLYGFCKTAYLNYSFCDDPKTVVAYNISCIANFSLATIGVAILYSTVAKLWTICKINS